jgi:hypothetical protein
MRSSGKWDPCATGQILEIGDVVSVAVPRDGTRESGRPRGRLIARGLGASPTQSAERLGASPAND